MSEIAPSISTSCPFSPRTAHYVAALMREGDNFDYCKWLQRVREEKAQAAKELRQANIEQIVSEEIGAPVSTLCGPEASPIWRLFNEHASIPMRMRRSRRKTLHSASGTRTMWRFEKIREAWDKFQANRTRDAVYGYLEAVFAIVAHYKVRRRTRKLLRHAFEFAELPFDKNANAFAAVIRCTCADRADNKTISKWARALRYVARCKAHPTQLEKFMKEAGGVNACANRSAKYFGRGSRR
jgi:hypothetical protein